MTEEKKTITRDRRAPGRVDFDDQGNGVWAWNSRTVAYSLDDTNALLEQLDDETLALVDTQGIEVTSRLQALRDDHAVAARAEPQDDGSGLYPREPVRPAMVSQPVEDESLVLTTEEETDDDAGAFNPYDRGARKRP